ncbi:protein serine/threonine phosphatase 2C, partial [Trametes versicolor FP-101664 SS1]|uniref:protein serine/threonine phosphatase 2C n=1 Tax=Trametes versicolor (strain FP-101664) TaxID=717944 RepID=UPI0004621E73
LSGHGGPETSEYTVKYLPRHLAAMLERSIGKHFGGRLDHTNIHEAEPVITAMLKREIVRFDWSIGRGVTDVCPDPRTLTEEDELRLVAQHRKAFEVAMHGTTLSVAVVDFANRVMWAAGVGDSTIALSTVDSTGVRRAERLCEIHNFKNPREYYRTIMAHHHPEKDLVSANNSLLGCIGMSRAIGDFSFKIHREYLRHIFRHINPKYAPLYERLRTPPYLIAEPSVRFVDLRPVWRNDPIILLFSDGVDTLVDGDYVFSPDKPSKLDPMDIVPALLSDAVDPRVKSALGHEIEPKWSRAENNMAVDILGNLLGGANAERLEMVMDRERLRADEPIFDIDDTTIVVARLTA